MKYGPKEKLAEVVIQPDTDEPELVQEALDEGAKDMEYGGVPARFMDKTLLCHAAMKVKVETCRLLLEHGANVDAQDVIGWTPLHFAAQSDSIPLAQMFLKAGANKKIVTYSGLTPYELIRYSNRSSYLRELLEV